MFADGFVELTLKPDDENAGYESEEYDLGADCEIRSLTRNGKNWKPTSELVQHEQFTEGVCTRAIVRKSYVSGRYDPYYHEAHYITQQILTHFSVRLEVPMRVEYKGHELERTFAIDTIVYILNRLFRMHQDELDVAWLNKLLQTQKTTNLMDYTRKVPRPKKTAIVQSFNGFIEVKFLVRPIASIYLLQRFMPIELAG
ncbi:unnamed protein product [Rhizophagus irregularis]|nr:unnamed protein product [Rhizophagus irregularis]CAB4410520.1 unnamed protein product [Rhizophagus irregularis]